MALLDFIFDTQNPARNRIIVSVFDTATEAIGSQVINDQNLSFSIQPVVPNPPGSFALYSPDAEDTDSYQLAMGLAGAAPTSGTFKLTVGVTTTGLLALAYNITAAALQTPLSAAFVTEGEAACTVTLIATGVYRIRGNANGAIPADFVVGDGSNLSPMSSAFITGVILGDAGTPYQMDLIIRQQPMVFSEPSDLLTAAGVTATVTAAGSSTSNRIQKISFDAANTYDGTYNITAVAGAAKPLTAISVDTAAEVTLVNHGFPNGATVVIAGTNSTPTIDGSRVVTVIDNDTFSVPVTTSVAGTQGTAQYTQDTGCGVAQPTITAAALALILAQHPQIYFNESDGTPDNIVVTASGQDYFVQFLGTLGNSSAPTLTVTNIDLVAPKGVSGAVNLNTIPLNEYGSEQSGTTFTILCSITRTRASGEVRTIFGPTSIVITKDILDPTTMVPPGLPTYLTQAQGDTLYGRLGVANSWTANNTWSTGDAIFQGTNFNITGTCPFSFTSSGAVVFDGFSSYIIDGAGSLTIQNDGDVLFNGAGEVRFSSTISNVIFEGAIIVGGYIDLPGYTVATLPSGAIGRTAYVTDALAPTYNATLVGGGAIKVMAFHNGTNWTAH